jgi:EAL domain-containing protein (putative c-di-GMP-specific phosphodiesterase class I)
VLQQACREAVFLQDMVLADPPLTMSVNISVKQLQQPNFIGSLKDILAETGLVPSRLVLEITESLLMIDTEAAVQLLTDLKRVGVRLAVDDFGTGYSSLGYLSRFPVDMLKIDRSFVSRLHDNDEALALVAAIVRLGETLNLRTVAEGIEDHEQLARLVGLGCQFGQGYLFGRPLRLDDALEAARGVGITAVEPRAG